MFSILPQQCAHAEPAHSSRHHSTQPAGPPPGRPGLPEVVAKQHLKRHAWAPGPHPHSPAARMSASWRRTFLFSRPLVGSQCFRRRLASHCLKQNKRKPVPSPLLDKAAPDPCDRAHTAQAAACSADPLTPGPGPASPPPLLPDPSGCSNTAQRAGVWCRHGPRSQPPLRRLVKCGTPTPKRRFRPQQPGKIPGVHGIAHTVLLIPDLPLILRILDK